MQQTISITNSPLHAIDRRHHLKLDLFRKGPTGQWQVPDHPDQLAVVLRAQGFGDVCDSATSRSSAASDSRASGSVATHIGQGLYDDSYRDDQGRAPGDEGFVPPQLSSGRPSRPLRAGCYTAQYVDPIHDSLCPPCGIGVGVGKEAGPSCSCLFCSISQRVP